VAAPGRDATAMLRLAASVDQLSPHVLAEAIVTEALNRGLRLSLPTDVVEQPGRGVTASIDGCRVTVGKLPADTVTGAWARAAVNRARLDSSAIAWVCVDSAPAGAVLLRDPLRRQAPRAPCGGCVRRTEPVDHAHGTAPSRPARLPPFWGWTRSMPTRPRLTNSPRCAPKPIGR
jgi:hypothetical protein